MPHITVIGNDIYDTNKYILKFERFELDSIFNPLVNTIINHANLNVCELNVQFDGNWYVDVKDKEKTISIYIDENTEFIYQPKEIKREPTITPWGPFETPFFKGVIYNIPYILFDDNKYLAFTIFSRRNEDIFERYVKETDDKYIEHLKKVYGDTANCSSKWYSSSSE